MSRPGSPTLEEQLQGEIKKLGLAPPKVYKGQKSQRRSAIEMLEKSGRIKGLRGGKRRRTNRRRRFSRRK